MNRKIFYIILIILFAYQLNCQSNSSNENLKTYSKYDFVPGEKVIFYDDFSDVALGEFPLKWNTTASGEIVKTNLSDGNWFKMMDDYSFYAPDIKTTFPENFTIEFDVIYKGDIDWWIDFYTNNSDYISNGYYPEDGGFSLTFVESEILVGNYDNNVEEGLHEVGKGECKEIASQKIMRYSIWGQKQRLRVYLNEDKIIDIPRAIFRKYNPNYLRIGSINEMLISNFRFAVGSPDTRNRLLTEGVFVTRGITFNSGSDIIKPESHGVLKEIASILNENKNLRIKIIGHTDSDGSDESNMVLSKKRATAVKNSLENQFNISQSRLEVDGKGESVPVSPNSNSEGKANNRRVEFIKIN